MNTITYAGSFNRDVYVHRLLFVPLQEFPIPRHFGSYQQSKLRGTGRKGRNSAVKSSQLKVGRQDSTKSGYSTISSLIQCNFSDDLKLLKSYEYKCWKKSG